VVEGRKGEDRKLFSLMKAVLENAREDLQVLMNYEAEDYTV